ncbi:MAG: hypothetical protein M3Q08_15205 [Pseudomonadota bacterium]|nr:hypothetical protein [Pseudomonadota bacterium]
MQVRPRIGSSTAVFTGRSLWAPTTLGVSQPFDNSKRQFSVARWLPPLHNPLACIIWGVVGALSECAEVIQVKMIDHFTRADVDYGRRITEGLGRSAPQRSEAADNKTHIPSLATGRD